VDQYRFCLCNRILSLASCLAIHIHLLNVGGRIYLFFLIIKKKLYLSFVGLAAKKGK